MWYPQIGIYETHDRQEYYGWKGFAGVPPILAALRGSAGYDGHTSVDGQRSAPDVLCPPDERVGEGRSAYSVRAARIHESRNYVVSGGTSVFRNSCATRKPRLYCSVKFPSVYAVSY